MLDNAAGWPYTSQPNSSTAFSIASTGVIVPSGDPSRK